MQLGGLSQDQHPQQTALTSGTSQQNESKYWAPVSCISQHLSRMFVETHGLSVMMETIATAGFWVKLCGLKEFSSFAGSSLQSVPEAIKGSVDTPHTTTIYIRSNLLSTPSSKELNNESKFEKRLIQQ
ncbi:unnamed protein product [Mucor fragilis]